MKRMDTVSTGDDSFQTMKSHMMSKEDTFRARQTSEQMPFVRSETSLTKTPPEKPTLVSKLWNSHHWTLEVLAIIVSALALTAIGVLLPIYHEKPMSSWHFVVPFNAVISVLGATARASIAFAISACISQSKWNWYRRRKDNVVVFDRFEEASRGPWGSVRLLWWSQLRHWIALGALAGFVLVGFEPCLQAIVTYQDKEVNAIQHESATRIGSSTRLDAGSHIATSLHGMQQVVNPETGEPFNITFLAMNTEYNFGALASVWQGFSDLTSPENLMPDFTCPTGNCTWNAFASLAVCSSCNDISDRAVRFTGKVDMRHENLTIAYPESSVIDPGDAKFDYARFDIPSLNLSLSNVFGESNQEEGTANEVFASAEMTAQATCQPGETISFQDHKTLVASFAMMQASDAYRNGKANWEDSDIKAEECALYFCTNIYQTAVEGGVIKEVQKGSFANRNLKSYLDADAGAGNNDSAEYNKYLNYSIYPGYGADMDRTDLLLFIEPEEYEKAMGGADTIDGPLRFNISQNAAATIPAWITDKFGRREGAEKGSQLIWPDVRPQAPQPAIIASLGTSPNLTASFGNVAASMTKWIRDRSLQQDDYVPGTARESIVYIHVQWGFFALPAAVLFTGIVFCLLAILETRGLGLPAWKGSSLAGLAYGLDGGARATLRAATGAKQVDAVARRQKVKLELTGYQYELVSAARRQDMRGRDPGEADMEQGVR